MKTIPWIMSELYEYHLLDWVLRGFSVISILRRWVYNFIHTEFSLGLP